MTAKKRDQKSNGKSASSRPISNLLTSRDINKGYCHEKQLFLANKCLISQIQIKRLSTRSIEMILLEGSDI